MTTDLTETKKPGRKPGWRKAETFTGSLALRVPQELEEWLESIAKPKGLSSSAMARMLLMEAKAEAEKAAKEE